METILQKHLILMNIMIHFPSAHRPAPASQEKGTRTPSPQTRKRHAKRKCTPQKCFLLLLECTIHQQNTFIKQYVTGKNRSQERSASGQQGSAEVRTGRNGWKHPFPQPSREKPQPEGRSPIFPPFFIPRAATGGSSRASAHWRYRHRPPHNSRRRG